MIDAQTFPYKIIDRNLSIVDRMAYLPLKLSFNDRSLDAEGLLDTGASVNVLPYELSLRSVSFGRVLNLKSALSKFKRNIEKTVS
jgi:hypothetical protein